MPEPLLIRTEQLSALGVTALDGYYDKCASHVATVFPNHGGFIRSASGRRFLQRCLQRARSHGLHDQHSIALYMDLAVALGEDFEQKPALAWIRDILENTALGSGGKMYLIYRDLAERCPAPPASPPAFDDEQVDLENWEDPEPQVFLSRAPLWWGEPAP